MTYPIPENEDARLQALHAYRILDTPQDERFNRIARLLAEQLGVPMTFVTLIDRDRQWIKACVGADLAEQPREQAMCAHCIVDGDILVVEDALEDARFRQNPLVAAQGGIRFYAGAPLLTSSGEAVGTICAVDSKPRHLSARERSLMKALASVAVDELELHSAGMRLREQASELQAAHTETLELNRELEHFLHAAAHDLRAPLRTVDAFSTILIEQLQGGAQKEAVGMAERIRQASTRLSTLTDDLLVYARMRASRPTCGPVDLNAALRAVTSDLETLLKEGGARVEVEALPQVTGVESRYCQLFQNLITNGVKFRRQGVPSRVRIYAEAALDDDTVLIHVQDNGRGFDPRYAEAIFEPFRRLERGEPGTGLGLTLCRKIAEDAGGSLSGSSAVGQGTRFTVRLPLAR